MKPKQLKIGGRIIDVQFVDGEENFPDGEMGLSFIQRGLIKIDNTMEEEFQKQVLLHEILEFVNDMFELKLEHYKITCLETALYQVLKDNKLRF